MLNLFAFILAATFIYHAAEFGGVFGPMQQEGRGR